MLEQHGDTLDGELGGKPKPRVEVMCVNGHTFAPTKDDIKTTESGKSPIAFCPSCGGVARVTKANLGKLFGFKRNDTRAYHATVKAIRAAQLNVAAVANAGPAATPPAGQGGAEVNTDLSRGEPDGQIEIIREGAPKKKEKEYTATQELSGDGTPRYRVRQDEDDEDDEDDDDEEDDDGDGDYEDDDEGDDEDDEEDDRRPPRRRAAPRKALRVRRPSREDEDELDEETEAEQERREQEERIRRGKELIEKRTRMPLIQEDKVFDPNDTLKEIVAESGLDEYTLERIYDYIDMQPDGWQPAAIQGVLQMYIAPALAQRLAARYQAEIFKETKRREREQQVLNLVGSPAGNMRLPGGMAQNQPPFGFPPLGQDRSAGAPLFAPNAGASQQMNPGMGNPSGLPQDPRFAMRGESFDLRIPQRQKSGVSAEEMRSYIDNVLAREREIQTQQAREDSLRRELADLRQQMVQMAQKPSSSAAMDEIQKQYVAGLQAQVNMLMNYLLQAAQQGGKSDLTGLQNEIRELKKSAEQTIPGLGGAAGSSSLKDLVELQKLSNDINVAKLEFQESLESKKFTKELVEGALQSIGSTIASVYTAKQTGLPIGAPMATPPQRPAPPSPSPPAPTPPSKSPQAHQPTVVEEVSPKTYSVKAQARGGKMSIPCPAAGCDGVIMASPEDTRVVCPKNPAHVFTLEPPKDVVDAITKKAEPETTVAEKPTSALVESVLSDSATTEPKPVVPPTPAHEKVYSGVL